jgi:hypothetical protein
MSDVNAAYIELLSAACAVDRIRRRYSLEDIAKYCEPSLLRKIVESANVVCKYFSQLETRRHK